MAEKEGTPLGGVEEVKEWQKKEVFTMRKDTNPADKQTLLVLPFTVPAICKTGRVSLLLPRPQEGVSATCNRQEYLQFRAAHSWVSTSRAMKHSWEVWEERQHTGQGVGYKRKQNLLKPKLPVCYLPLWCTSVC